MPENPWAIFTNPDNYGNFSLPKNMLYIVMQREP